MYSKENPAKEFDNGTRLYGRDEDSIWEVKDTYLIVTQDGSREIGSDDVPHFKYGDGWARQLAQFLDEYQNIPVPKFASPRAIDDVPIDVLGYSDPVIATYLRVVLLKSNWVAADVLGVKKSTVTQYKSDIMRGHRE